MGGHEYAVDYSVDGDTQMKYMPVFTTERLAVGRASERKESKEKLEAIIARRLNLPANKVNVYLFHLQNEPR